MDLVMDGSDAIVERFEPVEVTELLLESPEEGFLVTILPGVRLVALGRQNAMDQQPDPAVSTVILAALVGMEDLRTWSSARCIFEGFNDERRAVVEANRPADNFPGVPIHDRGQIEEGAVEVQEREITHPDS